MKTHHWQNKIKIIIISALLIAGIAFGLHFFLNRSKAQALPVSQTPPESSDLQNEPVLAQKVISFSNQIALSNDLGIEVLSLLPEDQSASIDIRWEPLDNRDWKISQAELSIESQTFSFAGFDLIEGLFHYPDGKACKITTQGDATMDDCSSSYLQEKPYRIDRLIFTGLPKDFLHKTLSLTVSEINAVPNEGNYCKALNIEHIQAQMQADFPGIELLCKQEPGMNSYAIKEGSPYSNENDALEALSNHASKALSDRILGVWTFDLRID